MRSHAGQNVLADLVGGAHGGAELLDVRFDGGMDLLGRIIKAEMLEQHGGGEDGGGRVGLVLTGDVRSGTVNRLEHGRELVGGVDAAGGGVAHAAHHGAGLIGQNVAKEVVGENHIETARVGDQEDGGRINVLVVVGDLRVFLADLVDDALPHITGVDEHVLLVHQGDVLLALHSELEGVTHHTLHTVCGIDGHLGGHLLRGVAAHRAAGTAVQTFGAFTYHHEVDVAVPHIRGGGEMGRAWYEQGRRLNKKHSFEDFVDATRALQKAHLADAWRTVANGGSAGGLLMGAIANMAPECYAGVEADVPFVDALTSILDPDLPLTVTEWDEWGDPLHDPEVYQYMKSYTPYENVPVAVLEGGNDEAAGDGSADGAATGAVAAAQFPRIFITTSMNDTRVLYVEPLKWLARLQSAGVDAVAKIEVEAGHGGLSGRYKQWEEVSYENAWCMDVMGLAH